ncbi:MAG TPA: MATE family efflux transporter [Bacteroidales bacterium]|nr:MATE family efflux transporter [Bacteroidales bacterium]HOX78512.1 MATE family efflux transporter [Bacteroidales bacterium]
MVRPVKYKFREFLLDIKEAITGTERDFTSEKLGRAIFLLSVPMVLEMAMESVFAIVDIYFVSRLGAETVAIVGITESIMTIVYALGVGLGTAATAIISRRIGEKDPEHASQAAGQAIFVGVFISLMLAVPSVIFYRNILHMMGMDEQAINEYGSYTLIILGTNMMIMLLFINNAIFRSSGDPAISMKVLAVANGINIILDPILIFGFGPIPALGIKGAAIATTIGRGLGILYQFYILFHGKHRIGLKVQHLLPDLKVILNLLKLASGAAGQHLIATSSWIFLVRVIALFGSPVVAGYTIAIRIMFFTLLPSLGVSNATATLVGQNLGAEKPERAERAVWITGYVNIVLLGLIGLFLALYPAPLIRLFIDDPQVIAYGTSCLRILSMGYIAYGLGMVMVNALNGAGDTQTPTWINLFCYWLFEIPLAYFLAVNAGMGQNGVFIAILAAEIAMTASALYFFRKGKWKLRKV